MNDKCACDSAKGLTCVHHGLRREAAHKPFERGLSITIRTGTQEMTLQCGYDDSKRGRHLDVKQFMCEVEDEIARMIQRRVLR